MSTYKTIRSASIDTAAGALPTDEPIAKRTRPDQGFGAILCGLVLVLSGCASVQTVKSSVQNVTTSVQTTVESTVETVKGHIASDDSPDDPIEPVNRVIYRFNDTLDRVVLEPVARGYSKVVPLPVRNCVRNIFANVTDITISINNALQGKLGAAASDVGRLAVNSTAGILGCFDVATQMGLEKHNEDFGQTLGYWGLPTGPYLMLPFFGPSTVRDAFGRFTLDVKTNAITYIDHVPTRNEVYALSVIDARASLLDARNFLSDASLDPYVFLREAYLGRRRNVVNDGKVSSMEDYSQPVNAPIAATVPVATPPAVVPTAVEAATSQELVMEMAAR